MITNQQVYDALTDMPSNQEAEEAHNEHMAKLFDALMNMGTN